jgi:hypothetical protein
LDRLIFVFAAGLPAPGTLVAAALPAVISLHISRI